MTPSEIKELALKISNQYKFEGAGPMDMTGLRPDQIAFYEALERGDHLDIITLPLTV